MGEERERDSKIKARCLRGDNRKGRQNDQSSINKVGVALSSSNRSTILINHKKLIYVDRK